MRFDELVLKFQGFAVIDTTILSAAARDVAPLKVQISRWEKTGKLIQLKRGIYLLSEPYRKLEVSELYLAFILKHPSYISLEKALEIHNLIPEGVKVYTSVTTKRPGTIKTPVGTFDYRHVKISLFWGYAAMKVNQQTAFVAVPEKALLDLFYLKHIDVNFDYLDELRLQNTEQLNMKKFLEYARRFDKPAIKRAATQLQEYLKTKT